MGGLRKSDLLVGGRRIVDRQLDALQRVADPIFLVAPDPSSYADLGLRILPDLIPDCGALGGIYTAVMASPRARTIVVACDMPFLSERLLQHFARVADSDLVIPLSVRGYEPLCALYSSACAEPIRRRLERRELEASVLPEGVRVEVIGPELLAAYDPDGLLFVNVNTPHDYERALARVESRPSESEDRIMDDSETRDPHPS